MSVYIWVIVLSSRARKLDYVEINRGEGVLGTTNLVEAVVGPTNGHGQTWKLAANNFGQQQPEELQ